MKRKPQIRKVTHIIEKDGIVYAHVHCGDWRPAIKLLSTGETVRSASPSLDTDLLMGRWQSGLWYLFGHDCDHVPSDAIMKRND